MILIACFTMCATVAAAEDVPQSGSVSVLNMVNNQAVSGTEFRLYRVADVDGSKLIWTAAYEDYHLKLEQEDPESFGSLPLTLSQYIRRDNIEADAKAVTDNDGKLEFNDLGYGVYLIAGDSYTRGDYRYDVIPSLIILPYLKPESSAWQLEADLEIKHNAVRIYWLSSGNTSIHVIKAWADESHEEERPLSVRVQLMRGSKVHDTVTLNSGNNWRHTWTELDKSEQWYVVEQSVPAGYNVDIEREGVTFVVTNNYLTSIDPGPGTPTDDKPETSPKPSETPVIPSSEPTNPMTPSPEPSAPSVTPEGKEPHLPQTGQPWLIVAVLSFGGIVSALTGAILLNKKPERGRNVFAGMVGMGLAYVILAGGLTAYNINDNNRAERTAETVKQEIMTVITDYQGQFENENVTPDYILDENREMPEVLINGRKYIGTVSIPDLGIELPVQTDCTADGLKTSPCRYVGSVYDDDCIIGGHNYQSHFGRLGQAKIGDSVLFTDIDGNEFLYKVTKLETVAGIDIDGAKAGEWDLTLFTCTLSGQNRILVRCERFSEGGLSA